MDLNDLYIVEVDDEYVRENFRKIKDFNNGIFLFKNMRFVEIAISGNVTNFLYPHKLGYMPKDVIQTSLIGTGTLTWNYSSFDSANLSITTSGVSGTITVRALIGKLGA